MTEIYSNSKYRFVREGPPCTQCEGKGHPPEEEYLVCPHCRGSGTEPEPSPILGMTAADLVGAGYYSTSRKYRYIAKLPEGRTGVDLMTEAWAGTHTPEEVALRTEESMRSQWLRVHCKETVVLSYEEYQAFRKAGGQSA